VKKYKHLFFDLDRTLWDFDTNARLAFDDLTEKYGLLAQVGSAATFFQVFNHHNEYLWEQYRSGQITKTYLKSIRFIITLHDFGVDNPELAHQLGDDYLHISTQKTQLIPDTLQILDVLHPHYKLHILTNGFNEVQYHKLNNSGLTKYFDLMITSEDAGAMKPATQIFDYALHKAGASKCESLMIGDDYAIDIVGAKQAGIDQVFFNVDKKLPAASIEATYQIESLMELVELLQPACSTI